MRPFGTPVAPVLLDVESRSRADLKLVGSRNYWRHPSTEVLCVCWYDTAIAPSDADDTSAWGYWVPGMPPPDWTDGTRALAAHYMVGFDRFALLRLGWRWAELIDTSELARRNGLPGALDVLGTRWCGVPKDKEASKFTAALSTIRCPTKKTAHLAPAGMITADEWKALTKEEQRLLGVQCEITPEMLDRVLEYCLSDVNIMRLAWPRLAPWQDITELEVRLSHVERAINDQGVPFDVRLAERLLEEDARNRDEALEAAAEKFRELGAKPPRKPEKWNVAKLKAHRQDPGWPDEVRAAVAAAEAKTGTWGAATKLLTKLKIPAPYDIPYDPHWTAERVREVANSQPQFVEFTGLPDAQKQTIVDALEGHGPPLSEAARVLCEARQAIASIARGKLEAGLRLHVGGRLYDMHGYCRAHTWRWGGQGFQLQNLPRPPKELEDMTPKDIDAEVQRVLNGGRATQDLINVLIRAVIGSKT